MMKYRNIIFATLLTLTAAQAAQVVGRDGPYSALQPIPLADGVTYVLPMAVLSDPSHARWASVLSSLPTASVLITQFPASPVAVGVATPQ